MFLDLERISILLSAWVNSASYLSMLDLKCVVAKIQYQFDD